METESFHSYADQNKGGGITTGEPMNVEGSSPLRTLLVGIDGASQAILSTCFEAGVAPTLESLFAEDIAGTLRSQVPPWTPSAWPTAYTGTNPGKHGVFGFVEFDGYDWHLVSAQTIDEWTIWEICDYRDLPSIVVNAPVTSPPPDIDGAVLPGYLAPEDPRCHPPGLLADVRRELGGYRIYPPTTDEAAPNEVFQEMLELARTRGRAFRYLFDRFEPSFGFLQFQQTDTVLHQFPGDMERVRRMYGEVDQQLKAVLEHCSPDTVMVVSDHGMDEYTYQFRVNQFLRKSGYISSVRGGVGMPSWAAVRENQLRHGADPTARRPGIVERTVAALAKVGLTSQRVGNALDSFHLLDPVHRLVPADAIRAASEQVDYGSSQAYMRTRPECGLRINLEGREPDGVVSSSDYGSVRRDLIELLSGIRTPDGRLVFDDVAPRERYFNGPHVEKAPDIVLIPRDFDVYLNTWLIDEEFVKPAGPTWDHTLNGVIAVAGDGVDPMRSLPDDANLKDVAPTVLATLGLSPTDRMDGRVLPFVEQFEAEPYPSYKADDESTTTADEATIDQLSSLGYLE